MTDVVLSTMVHNCIEKLVAHCGCHFCLLCKKFYLFAKFTLVIIVSKQLFLNNDLRVSTSSMFIGWANIH